METEPSHLNGSKRWLLIKAQVAAAVAIIKTRPPGVSGREHGEALGRRMRRRREAWKEKAQTLQQEVLRLRQQLLISTATADDTIMEDMSRDLFETGSPVFSADLPPDCDSETPDLLLQDPPRPPPPPPLPPPSKHQRDRWGDMLLPHMQFLQSLCSLQRLHSSRAVEAACLTPGGDGGSVVAETVSLLLDSVVAACKEPPSPGLPDLVPQACRVASRALDVLCSPRPPSVDVMRRVEEALRELTQTLLHSKHPSRAAEKLKESLIALGSSSLSKSFLICGILTEISSLAEQLWHTSQVQGSSVLRTFPMDQYQNSCHLLWILEQVLQDPEVAWRRAEVESEKTAFLRHLELRVFLLSDEFPLFSIFMWRIGKLLTSVGEKHV